MPAYDYPLLGVFMTTFFFMLWVVWLFILFRTVFDIFRSDDLSGIAKALWLIFVIILPYLGVFVYIIARGHKMAEHDIANARAQRESMDSYVRSVAGDGGGVAGELSRLADLKAQGVLTEEEFAQQKAKLLA